MKVILSRKGFDSEYGGQPSPILPDGTLLSFPIPQENDTEKFSSIYYNDRSYFDIIKELKPNNRQIYPEASAHLDPDLKFDVSKERVENWKPIFGQSGAAQSVLRKHNLKQNDLFLFFGWFRETEMFKGKLRYKIGKNIDKHLIFGYLQIDKIYNHRKDFPSYARKHSHASNKERVNNCIYVANESLSFNDKLSGAGYFKYSDRLCLTKAGMSRSKWDLPEIFKKFQIEYHKPTSFKDDYFKSAHKGQEFVIKEHPDLTLWTENLFL